MKNLSKKDICRLIEKDSRMMEALKTVKLLNLPDWWIGAGFVRNKIWDYLHDYNSPTALSDIDVIYFNAEDRAESTDLTLFFKT